MFEKTSRTGPSWRSVYKFYLAHLLAIRIPRGIIDNRISHDELNVTHSGRVSKA